MTQQEFFDELAKELRFLPAKEYSKVMTYYRDRINIAIDYGEKEEKVIASLMSPKEIAKETYEAYGPNFLEIRKKRTHQKNVFLGIVDCFLLAFIFVAFLGIIFIFGNNMVKMVSLLFSIYAKKVFLDSVLMTFFILVYLVAILAFFIYVFSFFYFIEMHFLENICIGLRKSGKVFSCCDFSLLEWITEKTKVKRLPLSIILLALVIMLGFGIASYSTKGYLYRSFENVPQEKEIYEYQDINKIIYNPTEATIYIKQNTEDDKTRVEYQYQFENRFSSSVKEGELVLETKTSSTVDLLNFLKEPTQIITIYLPVNNYAQTISIKTDKATIEIDNTKCDNLTLDLKITSGSFVATSSTLKELLIDSFRAKIGLAENKISKLTLLQTAGQIVLSKDLITTASIENGTGKNDFQNESIDFFTYHNNSGQLALTNQQGIDFVYFSTATKDSLTNINYHNIEINLQTTSNLSMVSCIASTKFKADVKYSSYLVLDYVKSPVFDLTGNNGVFFVNDMNKDQELTTEDPFISIYNAIKYDTMITLTNTGVSSKTEFDSCEFKTLDANIKNSYFYMSRTNAEEMKLVLNQVEYAKLTDVYLTQVEVELTSVQALTFKNATASSTKLILAKYDATSVGNFNAKNDCENVEVEVRDIA